MKKRIVLFLITLLIMTMPVLATSEGTVETTEAVETVSKVTSVAGITAIAILLVSIITFIISKLKWFKKAISSILNAFSTVFGKGGKIENLPQAISEIMTKFEEAKKEFLEVLENEQIKFEMLKAEYDSMKQETNEFKQAFAMLCIYANNINPYIKNEICRLINGDIPFKETFQETMKEIEEMVRKIMESEPKLATPSLDAITKE